jgi:hypothetical protein
MRRLLVAIWPRQKHPPVDCLTPPNKKAPVHFWAGLPQAPKPFYFSFNPWPNRCGYFAKHISPRAFVMCRKYHLRRLKYWLSGP